MVANSSFSALVTAGPTIERLDPVRYISNFSSGKQGYAIAAALATLGVKVTLISGPVALPTPTGVTVITVESAKEMLAASLSSLPVNIAICTAAVCDWRSQTSAKQKMKKKPGEDAMVLPLVKNPDILEAICLHPHRPALVVGFAAETENALVNARKKQKQKGCDWIVVNEVNQEAPVFGSDENEIHLIAQDGLAYHWPKMQKTQVAEELARLVIQYLQSPGLTLECKK
jgi:phosphopantothenoylcysteine decarboxylase / phosphopantothenate---cysteine ligase